jgi:hypothetical protein
MSQEKKEDTINLQDRYARAELVDKLEDLAAKAKDAEPYTFFNVKTTNETFVIVKDPQGNNLIVHYNGEDVEMLNIVVGWMSKASEIFEKKPRTSAELNYLRIMFLSLNNLSSLLNMDSDQYVQMLSCVCTAIAAKWLAADKAEETEENTHVYTELVARHIAVLNDMVARAKAGAPEIQ